MIESLMAAVAPQRIAFWSDRAGDPDVFTMAVDGSGVRNLGTRDWGDKRASWSPDGTRIAYDSWHAGVEEFDIWTMNADGSGKRRVTTSPLRDTMPAWSPTGDWIAFTRKRARSSAEDVWLIRPDGTGERLYARGGAWSPDGRRILYTRWPVGAFGDIYVLDLRTGKSRRLTKARADDTDASWSPDGKRIVFDSTRD